MSLRAGLVGFGLAGRVFHAPLLAGAGFDLAAVATSRREEVAQAFPAARVFADPAEMISADDLDLIVVAAPNDTHFPLARAALLAGKHVVVDKPFTLTSAEAEELIGLARGQARVLSVFQNRRWDGEVLALKQILAAGELGEVMRVEARFDRFRPQIRDRWREKAVPGGGLLWDLGPHLIDFALHLFGPPDWARGDVLTQRDGAEIDDGFEITLGKGRLRIHLGASSFAAYAGPKLLVHGSKGSFVKYGLDVQESQLAAGLRPSDPGFGKDPSPARLVTPEGERELPQDGRYLDFYTGLRDAIETGAEPPVSAQDGAAVIKLIEAVAMRN